MGSLPGLRGGRGGRRGKLAESRSEAIGTGRKRMTKRLLICAVLFLALEATGGGGKAVPARAQASDDNTRNDIGLNMVVALQGRLDIKRKGWSAFAPAGLGTTLQRGDLLRLEGSSQAKVVCADLTISDAPHDLSGVPCPATKPILIYLGDK